MMRKWSGLIGLVLLLTLLSGSTAALPPAASADSHAQRTARAGELLAQHGVELAAFEAELVQAAEELLQERAGELKREQAQKLHGAVAALREELQMQAEQSQKELNKELLGLQLQLVLVSLSPQEQEEKLAEMAALQEELELIQEELEAEFQERVQQLQAEHEELAPAVSWLSRRNWRPPSGEELASYDQRLWAELERELAEVDSRLSSALANRSY